jgi:WD40 repeat protein
MWDLATGQPVGAPLTGHTNGVGAVACTVLDGQPVAVTGSDDHTVRVWDLNDLRCIDVWPFWDAVPAVAADGGWLVAAAGWDIAVFALTSRTGERP